MRRTVSRCLARTAGSGRSERRLGARAAASCGVGMTGGASGAAVLSAVAAGAGGPVAASGGTASLDDIRALAAVGEGAIEGAITGRALYEGNYTLAQALAAARGEE